MRKQDFEEVVRKAVEAIPDEFLAIMQNVDIQVRRQPTKRQLKNVARGETLLFVDGDLAGSVAERLQPEEFVLGGAGVMANAAPDQADYKDWMIHHAGLNADEARAVYAGTLLQASLEIYAPLSGVGDAVAENLAQSASVIEVKTAGVTHSQD